MFSMTVALITVSALDAAANPIKKLPYKGPIEPPILLTSTLPIVRKPSLISASRILSSSPAMEKPLLMLMP
ncbi:hypothetical protein D3C77_468250 [compost metagenome]